MTNIKDKPGGRPAKKRIEKQQRVVSTKLTELQYYAIRKRAGEAGLRVSEYVRQAVVSAEVIPRLNRHCLLYTSIVYGLSKKKMPYLHLIDEAIGLLNTEIRLIEWRIKYPEQLQQRINKQPLSPDVYKRQFYSFGG